MDFQVLLKGQCFYFMYGGDFQIWLFPVLPYFLGSHSLRIPIVPAVVEQVQRRTGVEVSHNRGWVLGVLLKNFVQRYYFKEPS